MPVYATSIGVYPEKIFFDNVTNKSIDKKELMIINPNNESVYFSISAAEDMIDFSLKEGRINKNNRKRINVYPKFEEISKGIYEDIAIVTVSKSKKNNFKNGIGVKVVLNVTEDISNFSYYFENISEYYAEEGNITNTTKGLGLITGFSVLYNKTKGNAFVNLAIVALIILLLYYFTREKK